MSVEDLHGVIIAMKRVSSVLCNEELQCSTSAPISNLSTPTYRVKVQAMREDEKNTSSSPAAYSNILGTLLI